MIKGFYTEIYKIYKKWPLFILVLLVSIIVPLFGGYRIKSSFLDQYTYWARLSHDSNPYNFLFNKACMYSAVTTIITIIIFGLIIVSEEYKNKIAAKLQTTVTGFSKILISKMILIVILSFIFLLISFLISYLTYTGLPVQFANTFVKHDFISGTEMLKCLGLYLLAIIKIVIFHSALLVIFSKYYYVPLIFGLLNISLFFINYLPYGIYYRTDVLHQINDYIIYYNLLSFFTAAIFAVFFYRESFLRRIAKFSSI